MEFRLALTKPVRLTDSSPEIKDLVFRRPVARDFKGLPGELEQDHNQVMLSRVTGTELALIEKLDGHDYLRACGVLQGFFSRGQETGADPSAN